MNNTIPPSELIINPDGSIYHLKLTPDQIATKIITVGDPDRVDRVAKHFDIIEHAVSKREFKTVTGKIGADRITVISTGIGTDNVDIVLTELDALANIDFESRKIKSSKTQLTFCRLGTCGSLHPNIHEDSIVISEMSVGLDGLMHYYDYTENEREKTLSLKVRDQLLDLPAVVPYSTSADNDLVSHFEYMGTKGITITATGFYGPQGRTVIAKPKSSTFLDKLGSLHIDNLQMTNLEMETAGIYGMSTLLGHRALSINAVLANRVHNTFSNKPKQIVDDMIENFIYQFAKL